MQEEDELTELLTDIHAKRSYLLPHHGLMAVSSPELLAAYDELYSAIALTERQLSRREHEFVWMGVLIATDEILGTHHIKRFRDGGGTDLFLCAAGSLCSLYSGGSRVADAGVCGGVGGPGDGDCGNCSGVGCAWYRA